MTGPAVPAVEVLAVTGGSAGLAATYDAVRALAAAYDTSGDRLRGWADRDRRVLHDGDLLASAALAPLTFAEAEAAVLAAATGSDGALPASVAWEADAVAIRAALTALQAADTAAGLTVGALEHAVGQAAGALLLPSLPVLLPALVPLLPWLPAVAGSVADDLPELVAEHPELVEHAVATGGGLLDGLLLAGVLPGLRLPRDLAAAAAVLAATYGEPGRGRATRLSPPRDVRQPGGLADLVADLRALHDDGVDGAIEVRTATAPDGSVRHVVHLPGTDDMRTLPWTRDDDVRDLATNLLLLAGLDNPYQQGVLDAMAQAGVRPDEPVLLVGHSQGGMVAAAVLAADGPFSVTDVVTAGSPTALVGDLPAGTHVLSLEHRSDVVPLLDGAPNPDSPQQTTVTFDDGPPTDLVDAHELAHHEAAAAALDTAVAEGTAHPSVADAVDRLEQQGYVAGPAAPAGTVVTSQVFVVVRDD